MDDQWAVLVAEVQAQMKEAEADLPPADYQRLRERLVMVLAWIFSGRNNAHRGRERSISNRCIAMGAALIPEAALREHRHDLAGILDCSKQAANELKREAIDYLLAVTGATMRTIPDEPPMGVGAYAPNQNDETGKTDCDAFDEGDCAPCGLSGDEPSQVDP